MTEITTAHIVARKAFQRPCGRECAEWAASMLVAGHDGECLAMLASVAPPYSHFEVADLRDRALVEAGIPDLDPDGAVESYAVEMFRLALAGGADLADTLRAVEDLSIDHGYPAALQDFYTLSNARDSLHDGDGIPCYWGEGEITRQNIDEIVRRRAEAFVAQAAAPQKGTAAEHRGD